MCIMLRCSQFYSKDDSGTESDDGDDGEDEGDVHEEHRYILHSHHACHRQTSLVINLKLSLRQDHASR